MFLVTDHGVTRDKRTACCAMSSQGLVDCQGCLNDEIGTLSDYLDEREKACALEIVSLLNDAGHRGMGKKDLLVRPRSIQRMGKKLMSFTFFRHVYKHCSRAFVV